MAVQVLGKVAYFNKGAYNSQTNYEINDVVSYNGSSYVSLNDNNQGNLPTNTNYWSVVAEKGDKGDTGKPFVIEKTYSTIESMVADYDNMNVNDYVMIQGSIEEQENATLWTKREVEVAPYKWAYLADFSGASGITGATPNIHIGNVTEGNEPSVTRRSGSSNENPILDFVLKTGAKGDTGATGNGISSFEKTSTSGLVDTYTITFTNGTSTTIEVTNGRGIVSIVKTGTVDYVDTYTITYNDGTTSTFEVTNSEVTEEEFNDVVDELNYLYDDLPKVEGEGTSLTLDNTRKGKMSNVLRGNLNQKTSILPDGYTQVDYIESSGTQYINTGVNADYKLSVKFNASFQNNINGMFGAMIGTSSVPRIRHHFQIITNSLMNWAGLGDSGNQTLLVDSYNDTIYKIFCDIYHQEYYINNEKITGRFNSNDFDTGINYYLFARNNNGTSDNFCTMRLYNFKMYYEDMLIRDFVPCYRNSDNIVGLYDLVNNVFYTNQGTGVFTYGSVVSLPNPDYPQDVNVVSGDNDVEICGKNLFDKDNANVINAYISLGNSKITYSNGDNCIYIPIKNNTTYTVSKILSNRFIVGCTDVLPASAIVCNPISTSQSSNTSYTITSGNDSKYLVVYCYTSNDTLTLQEILDTIQIEKSSTASTYQPYEESQTYPINLGTMELCKIGNYQDYIYKDNDKWYKHSEIGKVVLNGSENWLDRQAGFTNYLSLKLSFSRAMTHSGLCNNFVYNSSYDLVQEHFLVNKTWQEIVITILKSRLNTADATGFKTWLSTHNTIIYYVLETPTNTEITDQTLITQLDNFEKAISYNTQTNISQENNDLPFIISASAFMSLKYIFGNLETRVAELETSEPSEL